jgi:hypothetical protein
MVSRSATGETRNQPTCFMPSTTNESMPRNPPIRSGGDGLQMERRDRVRKRGGGTRTRTGDNGFAGREDEKE